VEPRPLHKDWEKKTRFGQFDLLQFFFFIITGSTGRILGDSSWDEN
jgi:hypothetical protein